MHLSVKQSDSVDLLHHGGEGDALLSEPLGQAGVGEGVARGVDAARVGHLVHLAEDGEAGLHEALAGRPVPSAANRLIGEVVQSPRRPLLWPSPG